MAQDIHAGTPADEYLGAGSLVLAARQSLDRCESGTDLRALRWFSSRVWGALLCTVYPLLAIAPVIALHALKLDLENSTVTQLGVNCALVGFMLLSMQFVLTARLSWIEAPFGLDLVIRFHRATALLIVALLCAHALLIASDQDWPLLTRLHAPWYIWAGRIALVLLTVQVAMALFRSVVRLSYEQWRRVHNTIALTILALGFIHGISAGDDFKSAVGLIVWAVAPTLALAAWLHNRVIRPHQLARRPFRVHSVRLESPRIWTVTLDTPMGRPFHFLPGQFQFLRLLGSNVPAEEHPFTIASGSSRAGRISLTIKACGDFTTLIDQIRVGDRATVHGPFGRFSHDLHPDEGDMVFVAGGVGITPLMSMLRAMHDRRESRRMTLIYASRELDDFIFTPELIAMEQGQYPALKVIYVVSQPPPWWSGETGRVDARRLEQWCGGLEDKSFYLCCPSRMTAELIRGLRHLRVNPGRIHCDYFSL
jgi:predicted ferric reductase